MIIILIVVVLVVGVVIGLMIGSKGQNKAPAAEHVAELDMRLHSRMEFEHLIQANQLIEAIKLYRSETGASLQDARFVVDRKRAEWRNIYGAPISSAHDYPADIYNVEHQGAMQSFSGEFDSSLRDEVVAMLRQKSKIHAIKVYRERTGASLAEAKGAVDAIEAELPRMNDPLQY